MAMKMRLVSGLQQKHERRKPRWFRMKNTEIKTLPLRAGYRTRERRTTLIIDSKWPLENGHRYSKVLHTRNNDSAEEILYNVFSSSPCCSSRVECIIQPSQQQQRRWRRWYSQKLKISCAPTRSENGLALPTGQKRFKRKEEYIMIGVNLLVQNTGTHHHHHSNKLTILAIGYRVLAADEGNEFIGLFVLPRGARLPTLKWWRRC